MDILPLSPNPGPPVRLPAPSHPPPTHHTANPPVVDALALADDAFPDHQSLAPDLPFDDNDALSPLEKIYLYSRSKATFRRIFIAHALPEFLDQISPLEAIQYVLPLLSGFATDEDDQVKEAFVSELVTVILWFFSHCQLVSDDGSTCTDPTDLSSGPSAPPTISVQAFTPILGTLLLNPNSMVGGAARYVIVHLLEHIRWLNHLDIISNNHSQSVPQCPMHPHSEIQPNDAHISPESVGLFGKHERNLFEKEILWQIVIGMGRLDVDAQPDPDPHDNLHNTPSSRSGYAPGDLSVSPLVSSPRSPLSSPGVNTSYGGDVTLVNPYFPMTPPELSTSAQSQRYASGSINESPRDSSPAVSFASVSSGSTASTRSTTSSIAGVSVASSHSSPDVTSSVSDSSSLASSVVGPRNPTDGLPAHSSRRRPENRPNLRLDLPSPPLYSLSPALESSPILPTRGSPSLQLPRSGPARSPLRDPPLLDPHTANHSWYFGSIPPVVVTPEEVMLEPLLDSGGSLQTEMDGSAPRIMQEASQPGRDTMLDVDMDPFPDAGSNTADAGTSVASIDPFEREQQAAMGRLCSMSLMAAVTADGCLDQPTKEAFVVELQRIADDSIYWVRREASFALGALAKVLPNEIVILSLLPIVEKLLSDSNHHVRHSSLFALPAILGCLPPKRRRRLALDRLTTMSMDESGDVRSGVLEALGEVISTFGPGESQRCLSGSWLVEAHRTEDAIDYPMKEEDQGGGDIDPPELLLRMFLGKRDGLLDQPSDPSQDMPTNTINQSPMLVEEVGSPSLEPDKDKALDSFFSDPARPLICAFNYPAVALTYGRERWDTHLRSTYLDLTRKPHFSVRRTLAASLAEIARIIGPHQADRDLIPFWKAAARCDEEEVRMKLVDCLGPFVAALTDEGRDCIMEDILICWENEQWKGWREREWIARGLKGMTGVLGRSLARGDICLWNIVCRLLRRMLWDGVNAVREGAIDSLPYLWWIIRDQTDYNTTIRGIVSELLTSPSSRGRMTFVACQQALVLPTVDGNPVIFPDDEFWESFTILSRDRVLGVRIAVARFVGSVCRSRIEKGVALSGTLLAVLQTLLQDASVEVRAYVPRHYEPSNSAKDSGPTGSRQMNAKPGELRSATMAIFSRPPLLDADSPSVLLTE